MITIQDVYPVTITNGTRRFPRQPMPKGTVDHRTEKEESC